MLKGKALLAEERKFLTHIDDWFYKLFSSHSHLSLPGLILRSSSLRPRTDEAEEALRRNRLDKQRSDAAAVSILMTLCILTEISAACSFGLSEQLAYVWGVINPYFGMAKELYDLRYHYVLKYPAT